MEEHQGTIIYYLQFFLFVFSLVWWIDIGANIMFILILSYFFLSGQADFLLADGEWSALSSIHSIGTIDLKLSSGKLVQLKNV